MRDRGRLIKEVQSWPYGWPESPLFRKRQERGCITGQLLVHDNFRQYGLWERYPEILKDNDLIYTVGTSDWRTDWYFAHTCSIENDGSFRPTTWQVKFQLSGVEQNSLYKLRLAIASSNNAAIQVRFNDANTSQPLFDTKPFGKDNAIARHGVHCLYYLFNIDVSGNSLVEGENTLYLTQRKATGPFTGVMYDYLRLEKVSS